MGINGLDFCFFSWDNSWEQDVESEFDNILKPNKKEKKQFRRKKVYNIRNKLLDISKYNNSEISLFSKYDQKYLSYKVY